MTAGIQLSNAEPMDEMITISTEQVKQQSIDRKKTTRLFVTRTTNWSRLDIYCCNTSYKKLSYSDIAKTQRGRVDKNPLQEDNSLTVCAKRGGGGGMKSIIGCTRPIL